MTNWAEKSKEKQRNRNAHSEQGKSFSRPPAIARRRAMLTRLQTSDVKARAITRPSLASCEQQISRWRLSKINLGSKYTTFTTVPKYLLVFVGNISTTNVTGQNNWSWIQSQQLAVFKHAVSFQKTPSRHCTHSVLLWMCERVVNSTTENVHVRNLPRVFTPRARPRLEHTTSWSRVRRSTDDNATTPPNTEYNSDIQRLKQTEANKSYAWRRLKKQIWHNKNNKSSVHKTAVVGRFLSMVCLGGAIWWMPTRLRPRVQFMWLLSAVCVGSLCPC